MVALLSGLYRNSQRMVQSALVELFEISISLGTVNKLRLEASNALANCVDEAKLYVQQQPIVGADETGFSQGNIDGCNPQERQAWLWVAVTPLVTFFEADRVGQYSSIHICSSSDQIWVSPMSLGNGYRQECSPPERLRVYSHNPIKFTKT